MSEGGMSSGEESEPESRIEEDQDLDLDVPERKRKPGIIYLSSVPEGMTVGETTSFFAEFGAVGRLFLQPDPKLGMRHFTEGWIEFLSKKVAKRVAQQINNTQVDGKRRHKPSYALWNIKYLPRFKWVHLSERLAYERAVKQQRMRTEISQVKRETEHFAGSVRVQKKKRKKEKEGQPDTEDKGEDRLFHFDQDQPESVIRKRKLEQSDTEQEGSKMKKMKKEKKSKKKKEEAEPVVAAPISKPKKDKKGSKKKKKKISEESRTPAKSPKLATHRKSAGGSSDAGHRKSASGSSDAGHRKSGGSKDEGGSSRKRSEGLVRRKSGEGDRAAFLKSVFGGGS